MFTVENSYLVIAGCIAVNFNFGVLRASGFFWGLAVGVTFVVHVDVGLGGVIERVAGLNLLFFVRVLFGLRQLRRAGYLYLHLLNLVLCLMLILWHKRTHLYWYVLAVRLIVIGRQFSFYIDL